MRIVVDINHPAHVHYFKNFIWEMQKRGHEFFVTASEKDVTYSLLEKYGITFVKIGNYGKSLLKKIISVPILDLQMYKEVKKFKPDILIGFGSIRAAHVSFLLRKPCINFEDTEHSTEQIRFYLPFVTAVITPSCYRHDLGKKQVRFNGYMELAALHPNRFTPNPQVLTDLGLVEGAPFIVIRFISWDASHDFGKHGITLETKKRAIQEFQKFGRIFISSEKDLTEEFEKYRLSISPEKMHDLLYYATLLYGESATMASECAVLGTHAIFCDFAGRGYTDEEDRVYNLVYNFKLDQAGQEKSIDKAISLLHDLNLKQIGQEKKERLLREKIDVTAFMIWIVENYHENINKIKKDLEMQEIYK